MTQKRRKTVAWVLTAPCVGWALLRLSGLDPPYPLGPALSFTPYLMAVAGFAALVSALLRQWKAAGSAALVIVLLALLIAPRVLGGPDEETDGREVRAMTANLHFGAGDPGVLLAYAQERGVEILAVQEVTEDFALRFKELGGRELFPFAVLDPGETKTMNGVYSRYPIERLDAGEEPAQVRTEVTVEPDFVLSVISAHAPPPRDPGSQGVWEQALDAMPAPETGGPSQLLLGDFNATFDHSKFRDLVNRGYEDAAEQMGEGLTATWPTEGTPLRHLPITIDHVLYEESGGTRAFEVLDLPGSDHRTLYAEIVIATGG